MTGVRNIDFDIDALYLSLDAERRARRLSWQGAAREINAQFVGVQARPISASTLSGMRTRRALEGDGVLQMLRWLGRTPESFVPRLEAPEYDVLRLPEVPPDRILRFNTRAIYAALDARRIERKLTWNRVAAEIGGCTAPSLTRLTKGGRTGFPEVIRIARWLGRPVASFTRASAW